LSDLSEVSQVVSLVVLAAGVVVLAPRPPLFRGVRRGARRVGEVIGIAAF
jgi:hypothetical protein